MSSGRRGGAFRLLAAMSLATVSIVLLGACSVVGSPEPEQVPDLASRSVTVDDFPSTATPIPAPAVPGLIADITGRPLHGSATPADCMPPEVGADGAVALSGPAGAGAAPGAPASTLTTVVTGVSAGLDTVARWAAACSTYRTGSPAAAESTISVEAMPPPPVPDGVEALALRRTITTGGGETPAVTTTTTLIAQRDDVRVYVDLRSGAGQQLTAASTAELDELFTRAVGAAFST